MQNTKTEYNSSERTPVVLPEMEQLLPPLGGEQFSSLERGYPGKWLLYLHHRQREHGYCGRTQPLPYLRETQPAVQNAQGNKGVSIKQ